MRRTLWAILLFVTPGMAQVPFGAGETLVYEVNYRAALIPPINIMRVSVRTLEETLAGRAHYHVVGNGRTVGAAANVFAVNDTYHTWLDAVTLLPSRTSSDIDEKNYRMTTTYTYDWTAMRVSGVRRSPKWKEGERRETFALPSRRSGDALSLLYMLRAIDATRLAKGEGGTLQLVLARDAKPIVYKFLGREEVKVRKVGKFRAMKFSCTMATSDGSTYEEGMTFTAWISDDGNKIPLMISSPVRVGRVTVTLAPGFKPVGEMTSRIE